jgi:anti-sigma factor (TIGR02949 family)
MMTDCARILSLLDVYLDDEATAETNVMVQQHVERCEACARQLQWAHHLRASMRDLLRHDRAPASLHQRVGALLTAPRPSLASFIRGWIVPATATAIVAWIVLPWRPVEPDIYPLMAVVEHVACALDRAVPPRDVSHYTADTSMPLIPGAGGKVRILEAHACGQQTDYLLHMILEEGGTKASIFITRAGEGAARIFRPRQSGDFEVSQVRTTRHRAFVVIDRTHARALREWREPAVRRLQQFLKQLEGA